MSQQHQAYMNTSLMRIFLWSGVAMVAALVLAQGLVMGFVPGPSPALGAEKIAQIFTERRDHILIGALIQIIFWTFYGTWSVAMVMLIRRMERGMPALTYAALVNSGGAWVIVILIPMTWAATAFRAGEVSPDIIMVMNDWVWFLWLYTWPSFSVFMVIVAVAVFLDRSSPTVFPRWFAFYNLWSAILIFPAGMIGFFKTGPFAWDGLISFWFAVVVFFGWMVVSTMMMFRAVATIDRQQSEGNVRSTFSGTVLTAPADNAAR